MENYIEKKKGDDSMRKILILCILLLFVSTATLVFSGSFERTEFEPPEISGQLSKLEGVTGWTKLPEGQWIEKQDRIPRYISVARENLQDYEKYSLGIDNFQLLEIRELKYEGKDYYILYKHYTNGRYKYKNIEKGWRYWYYVDAYVFEKNKLPVIQLVDKKSQLFKIEVIANAYEFYHTQTYGEEYIKDISKKIPALVEEDLSRKEILIVNTIKLDDKVRFLLLEKNAYMYGLKGILPIGKDEILTEEVFRNFYYETDLTVFKRFWKIN